MSDILRGGVDSQHHYKKYAIGEQMFPLMLADILDWLDYPKSNKSSIIRLREQIALQVGLEVVFGVEDIDTRLGFCRYTDDNGDSQNCVVLYFGNMADAEHVHVFIGEDHHLQSELY